MSERQTIEIRDGVVYFDSELYNSHFQQLETVMLLLREPCLWILPVQHRSGGSGLLMEVLHANGHRTVNAGQFLRANRLERIMNGSVYVHWDEEADALCVEV